MSFYQQPRYFFFYDRCAKICLHYSGLLEDMKHTLEEAESFDEQIMATSIIETM